MAVREFQGRQIAPRRSHGRIADGGGPYVFHEVAGGLGGFVRDAGSVGVEGRPPGGALRLTVWKDVTSCYHRTVFSPL